MKIALIGYGKMGHIIEEIARERGHEISHKIDIGNLDDLNLLTPPNTDAAIEFTHPGAAYENIKSCLLQGIPVLSGTTGWLARKNEIEELCIRKNGTFFYASNYSIGVNLFFRINEIIAGIMNSYPAYDAGITEIHHNEKKDAPSGTAITLAEGIISNLDRKDGWVSGETNETSKIPVESIREGKVPGTHIIKYHSAADLIELKHEAFSRKGFALGAVMVAEWIRGKNGVLSMKDFLKI
jgi:4-hydroxy-tetrahydrodipicolinate reductase